MSVGLYDEALTEKIKNWIGNAQVTITSPGETKRIFEVIADKTDDKPIALPLICLRRNAGYTVLHPSKTPMSYDGFTVEANEKRSIQINAIPISIQYQLDLYTRYFKEADEYMRNIVFNMVNFPRLTVNIPYQGDFIEHYSNITMSGTIEDNSDIPERLIPGQFTRMTMSFSIEDAHLWDVRVRDNITITADVIS